VRCFLRTYNVILLILCKFREALMAPREAEGYNCILLLESLFIRLSIESKHS
jgi:hypothetical protein